MTTRTTSSVSYNLTYNAENHLTSVSGNASASFLYDGDGQRVKGVVNGVTSYYVGNHYELAGGTIRKYYYAGGQRVAMRNGGTLHWLLSDHLGGTAYTVSGATETAPRGHPTRYKAFGATRFTSGTTPTSFRYTGQREEISFGLYYYGARWYDPALGHFVQADTLVPDASHAGDYHRYAYTRFNPVKYTDPTGHIAVCFRGAPNSNKEEDPGNVFFQLCRQGLAAGGYDESVHGKIMEFDFNRVEDMQTAFQAILRRNRDEPVIVIGHSWGGAAALRLAKEFESYQQSILANPLVNTEMIDRATIDLLVTIDPERFGRWNTPDSVPHHSVRRAYNITPKDGWAENYGAPLSLDGFDWPWNFQNGTNNIEGALNVELAQVQGVEMNHSSIVDLNYRRANGDQPKVNPITRSLIAVGVCMALSHCK